MPGTHFEMLVEKAIAEEKDRLAGSPVGFPERDSLMKGKIAGLQKSLEIFRQAARADNEADL